MAALNFPSSPTLNQVYSANGKSWTWNGTSWAASGTYNADQIAGSFISGFILADDLPAANGLTGDLVGTTDTQTLTNKTLGDPVIASGTTAERPASPVDGNIRFNSDLGQFEGYSNGSWSGLGGGAPDYLIMAQGIV